MNGRTASRRGAGGSLTSGLLASPTTSFFVLFFFFLASCGSLCSLVFVVFSRPPFLCSQRPPCYHHH